MTENPKDTPWEPPLSGSEVEHVLGALDRLRWTFRYKADEFDAAGLDTRIGPSSLTLGGLLKHLATQEDFATAVKMDGEEMPAESASNGWDDDIDWEFSSAAGDSPEAFYARYDGAVARARERLRVRACGREASTSRWLSRRSSASRSACAGSSTTWWRSTAATPARRT